MSKLPGLASRALSSSSSLPGMPTPESVISSRSASVGLERRGHQDRAGRRRVHGRVVEQLGEQVDEAAGGGAGDRGAVHRLEPDPLVLLHLGGGGAEDVGDRAPARCVRVRTTDPASTSRLSL